MVSEAPSSSCSTAVAPVSGNGTPGLGNGASGSGNGPKPPAEILGAVCLLTSIARERGKKRMEGKLAQRFGYIIIAVTLFWLPLVTTLLLQMGQHHWALLDLETSAVVLTCVPAAVDPLIYTMVTRQFRSEFTNILSSIRGCPLRLRT